MRRADLNSLDRLPRGSQSFYALAFLSEELDKVTRFSSSRASARSLSKRAMLDAAKESNSSVVWGMGAPPLDPREPRLCLGRRQLVLTCVKIRDEAEFQGRRESASSAICEKRASEMDIARHLERHGTRVEVQMVESGASAVSEVILDQARRVSADLVVMGGYGHSRAREWVLGGATLEVLENSEFPILMAH